MADDDLEAIRAARRQQLQSQAGPSGGGGGGGGGDEQQQKQEAQCVESFRKTFLDNSRLITHPPTENARPKSAPLSSRKFSSPKLPTASAAFA